MSSCGIDVEANDLKNKLTSDFNYTLPPFNPDDEAFKLPGGMDNPLYKPVEAIDNAALTECKVDGKGTFDLLAKTVRTQLQEEYRSNRITGGEYTKSFIALMEAAMNNAVQFLLGRDQARWQAITAQIQAITARMNMEVTKNQVMLTRLQVQNASVEYALGKAKLASEGNNYCIGKFNLEMMLPQQLALMKEQTESARAQTLDTRTDGQTVKGSVGKQGALYSQQIVSYKNNDQFRYLKTLTDSWIAQKTIDEGLLAPTNLQNSAIDSTMTSIKSKLEI